MADATLQSVFGDIADAIRFCNGLTDKYLPDEMAAAIRALPITTKKTITYRNKDNTFTMYEAQAGEGETVSYEYPYAERIIKANEQSSYSIFIGWTDTFGSTDIITADGTVTVESTLVLYPVFHSIADNEYTSNGLTAVRFGQYQSISRGGWYRYEDKIIVDISVYFSNRFSNAFDLYDGFPVPDAQSDLIGTYNRSFKMTNYNENGRLSWNGGSEFSNATLRIWGVYTEKSQ